MMDPSLVSAVMEKIQSTWRTSNSFEVTLEANPTSVEAGRFAGYRDAGVSRVSLGVQALNDADLKALGRLHTVSEARAAFDIARNVFDRVSFDLIYARQGQTLADWTIELRTALSMAVDHLSLYQLTIEEGTAFGDRYAAGKLGGLPDDDCGADMYQATQHFCEDYGFPAYEISNHAREGEESQHNLIYWKYGDYLGIGPGAHGRLTLNGTRFATSTCLGPTAWLRQVETTNSGEEARVTLSADDIFSEFLLMGMRLRSGVSIERLESLSNRDLNNNIKYLSDLGLVEKQNSRLCTTPKGRPVLNGVLRALLDD